MFGLPNSGPLPEEVERGVVPENTPPALKIHDLNAELETMDVGPDFLVKFVLFACGCLLCPTSKLDISTSLWAHIVDVEKIRQMNWCGHILRFCCKQMQSANKKTKKEKEVSSPTWVGGCLFFLAV